jgi:hypothetical protein
MDSDNLSNLPPVNNQPTEQERSVVNNLFGTPSPPQTHKSGIRWKNIGIGVVAFAILANPWIDKILEKLPYCDNPIMVFGIKIVLFFIILFVSEYFL